MVQQDFQRIEKRLKSKSFVVTLPSFLSRSGPLAKPSSSWTKSRKLSPRKITLVLSIYPFKGVHICQPSLHSYQFSEHQFQTKENFPPKPSKLVGWDRSVSQNWPENRTTNVVAIGLFTERSAGRCRLLSHFYLLFGISFFVCNNHLKERHFYVHKKVKHAQSS